MSQVTQADAFAILQKHEFANLTTFRKNGTPVVTPVWFALANGKAYVMTTMEAGKTKRIRNSGRVLLAPSDRAGKPLGETIEAMARILPPEEEQKAKDALDDKYGLMKATFDFFLTLRGVKRAWIEISPI